MLPEAHDEPTLGEARRDELPAEEEPLGWRPRPALAILALLVVAAMVAAALGGYSFIGPEAPTPDPTPTPIPARTV
jgi:hypothetical protein